ncbi:MAG: RNA 2',3'-cyclic phosphodiesterase [Terracidiphilus sp.]
MRFFVGIPLAGFAVAELAPFADRLRSAAWLRWPAPESWHITLQFLGNTSDEQYNLLTARLAEVHCAAVPIRLGGLGVFDRAGIFYAEVEPTPELVALERRIAAATALCGFERDTRPYHPHITLARGKGPNRARELRGMLASVQSQPKFPRFTAVEFLLYESHLSASGSTYEVRRRFPLGTATGSPI